MEYRILGPLEVFSAGIPIEVGGPRHRKLLAVLLVNAGETVSSERLINGLWGEDPPISASSMLHVRISEIRNALRAGRVDRKAGIVTGHSGYQLQVEVDELDSRRFEWLAGAGRQALARGDNVSASAKLHEALALWRGPPLSEVADEQFAQSEIARLEALHLQALEDRLDADLSLGHHAEIAAELEALVAEHPLRERFWYQLMLAHYRAGRQGDALQTYQAVRTLLVGQLGVEPGSELRRMHVAILDQDRTLELLTPVPGGPPNNLPGQLATFIGRKQEMAEIRELLQKGRLVTLVGAGGVGKSRLALEAATNSLLEFRGGTWLVELAPLTQPGLVAQTLASVLGVREHPERLLVDLIAEHLATTDALLVLDNCEHLLDEVATLAQRLLRSCARLSILATSRERLGITGELLRLVSGLAVPEPGADEVSKVGDADASRLLVERAAAALPGFRLDHRTAGAVTQICRQLDGLPLAIELAAARVNALDVEQIAARLGDRFRLLGQGERTALPRHRTLRGVVDWSYGLLSTAERLLFDRAAVFVGGFTLAAVEAVCGPEEDDNPAASLLSRLVDKSLIVSEHTATAGGRYRILETLRMYGLERLDERGETSRVRDSHAAYFLSLAEMAGEALRSPEQVAWVSRVEAEHGNFRAALQWSLDHGAAETAARLAGSLYALWDLHGYYSEGRGWLAQVLAPGDQLPAAVRARALLGSATLAVIQGDLEHAAGACEEAAALCRQLGDPAGLAHALQYLGLGAIFADDIDSAVALLEESLSSARIAGDGWLEAWALIFLAAAALARDAYGEAANLASACEAVLLPVGDPECMGWALVAGAMANLSRGDHAGAIAPLREALEAFQGLGALWGLSIALFVTAQSAGARGDQRCQAVLLGASEGLRMSVGAGQFPFVAAWLDAAIAELRTALGEEGFDRAWRTGQQLPLDAALAEAMGELDAATGTSPVSNSLRQGSGPTEGRQ
jgi:predicted ATPase/DNA-binding SARP family transcriptional activator